MRRVRQSLTAGLLCLLMSGSITPGLAYGMEGEDPDAASQETSAPVDQTEEAAGTEIEDNSIESYNTAYQTELPNEAMLTYIASVNTNQFTDVGTTHRAKDEIYYLASGGIIYGTSADKFSPARNVTRGEAAAMVGRMLSLDGTKRATEFTDVGAGNFASGYIQAAADRGIISGYKDGSFKPDQPVTRGEMAFLINKALNFGATSISGAASLLMNKGIAQGLPDGTFGQNLHIIRADFSVFLARSILADLRIEPNESFDQVAFITATDLNVRTGPGTKFTRVAQLQPREVRSAYQIGEWYYITWAEGKTGFVHGDYLSNQAIDDITKILQETHIIVDPGHGYTDPGATGFGTHEKDVVLDVATRVKGYIQQTPLQVSLTRESDRFLSLAERVTFAKEQGGDIFVSIHTNAYNGEANGTETYYYKAAATNPYTSQSRALAIYIQNRVLEAWGLYDRGVKPGNFHVLRENTMPAVLVELGFIDNTGDYQKISSPEERQKAAKAIFFGILDYYYHYEGLDIQFLYTQMNASPSPRLH
ncbi:N-acetylmuramoyl-L-alanine amidase [Bacillus oleivorans]|uniref:N-acetylmuramoyl-L-alanine amidase n=1 Tax=Bacillus oleivorans TaxID=1448271 RepID=A0A285CJ07_9BACI|nr:N-acetylmuramoyl-L-alanine amidase [Bacillus oleivorans]SNX67335.1 N-acetylmuramoyl-L-alanine amidase [Bacillus oleivorans]